MKVFYQFFYSRPVNTVVRSLLRPFRFNLPPWLKIPIQGPIDITDKELGISIRYASNETCTMVRDLFWNYRGFSFEFSAIFRELIKSTDTFLDIGANVGYYSLLGAKLKDGMQIYSLEPSAGPLYFLKENVAINGFKNIHVIGKAVDRINGKISFFEERNPKYGYTEHHASGIGNTVNSWGIDNYRKYDVDVTTVDELVASNGLTSVDLIKIDTEGTEDTILTGGMDSIRRFQPIMICEVLSAGVGARLQQLVVDELGFLIYQFRGPDQLVAVENLEQVDKTVYTNFFFVPPSKRHLLEAFIR